MTEQAWVSQAWLEARSFLACRAPVTAVTKGHPDFEGSSWSSPYLVHAMTSCCLTWTLAMDIRYVQFSSVQVVFDSLWPQGPEHARPPCPSPTPRVGVHCVGDTIHPSHPLLSPSPSASIFPSIRVFFNESAVHIRWPKYWSLSFSFSICPSNEYSGLISLGWTGWISLQSKGLWRVFSSIAVKKHQFFGALLSL